MEGLHLDPVVDEKLRGIFFSFNEETAQASVNALFNEFGVQKTTMGFTYYSFGIIYSRCQQSVLEFVIRNLQQLFERQECIQPISMAFEYIYLEHRSQTHIDPTQISALFPASYRTSYTIIHSYALCLTRSEQLGDLGNQRLWAAISGLIGPNNQPDIGQVYSLSHMATCCVADYAGRLLRTAGVQNPQLAAFIGALIGTTTAKLQQHRQQQSSKPQVQLQPQFQQIGSVQQEQQPEAASGLSQLSRERYTSSPVAKPSGSSQSPGSGSGTGRDNFLKDQSANSGQTIIQTDRQPGSSAAIKPISSVPNQGIPPGKLPQNINNTAKPTRQYQQGRGSEDPSDSRFDTKNGVSSDQPVSSPNNGRQSVNNTSGPDPAANQPKPHDTGSQQVRQGRTASTDGSNNSHEQQFEENPRLTIIKALCMFGPEITTDIDIFAESIGIISNEYRNFNNSISSSMIGRCVALMINSGSAKLFSTSCPEKPRTKTIQLKDMVVSVNPSTFSSTREDALVGLHGEKYNTITPGNFIPGWDMKTFFTVITKAYNDLSNLYENNPETRHLKVTFSSIEFFRELDCPKTIMNNDIMIQIINFLTSMRVSLNGKYSSDSSFNVPLPYLFSHWDNPVPQLSVLFTVLAVSKKTTNKLVEYFDLSVASLNGNAPSPQMLQASLSQQSSGSSTTNASPQNQPAAAGPSGSPQNQTQKGKQSQFPSLSKIRMDLETIDLYLTSINWSMTPHQTPSIYRLSGTKYPVDINQILRYLIYFYGQGNHQRSSIMAWVSGSECAQDVSNIANENVTIYLRTHSYIFECTDFVITMFYLYHRFIFSRRASGYANKRFDARIRDIMEFFMMYSSESSCQLLTTMYDITRIANRERNEKPIVSFHNYKGELLSSLNEVLSVENDETKFDSSEISGYEGSPAGGSSFSNLLNANISQGSIFQSGDSQFSPNKTSNSEICSANSNETKCPRSPHITFKGVPSTSTLFLNISHAIMHLLLHDKKQYYKHIFSVLISYNQDFLLLNFLRVYNDQSPDLITRQLDILTDNRSILHAVDNNIRSRVVKADKGRNLSPNLFQLDLAVIASGRSHINIVIHIVNAICRKGARFVATLIEYLSRKIITIIDHSDPTNSEIEMLKKNPSVVRVREAVLSRPCGDHGTETPEGSYSIDSKREKEFGVSHTNISDTTILHILTTLDAFYPLVDIRSAVIPLKNGRILNGRMVLGLLGALKLNMRQQFDLRSILAVNKAERDSGDGTILVDDIKIDMSTVNSNALVIVGQLLNAAKNNQLNGKVGAGQGNELENIMSYLRSLYKTDNKSRILICSVIERLILHVMQPDNYIDEFPTTCTCLGQLINRDIIREHYLGAVLNIIILMLSSKEKSHYTGGLLAVHGILDEPSDRISRMRAVLSVLLETRAVRNDSVLSEKIDKILRSNRSNITKSRFIPDSFKYSSIIGAPRGEKVNFDWRLMPMIPDQDNKLMNFALNNLTKTNAVQLSSKVSDLIPLYSINLSLAIISRAKKPAHEFSKLVLCLDEHQYQTVRRIGGRDPVSFAAIFLSILREQVLVFFARLILLKFRGDEQSCIDLLKAVHLDGYARYKSPLLQEFDNDILKPDQGRKVYDLPSNRNGSGVQDHPTGKSPTDQQQTLLGQNDLIISHGIQPIATSITDDSLYEVIEILGILAGSLPILSSRCLMYSDGYRSASVNKSSVGVLRIDFVVVMKELLKRQQNEILQYVIRYVGEFADSLTSSLYKVASSHSPKYEIEASSVFRMLVGGDFTNFDQAQSMKFSNYTQYNDYLINRVSMFSTRLNNSNYYLTIMALLHSTCCRTSPNSIDYFDVVVESIYKSNHSALLKGLPSAGTKKHKSISNGISAAASEQKMFLLRRVRELSRELSERYIQREPTHIPVNPSLNTGLISVSSNAGPSRTHSAIPGFSSSCESSDIEVEQCGSPGSPNSGRNETVTKIRFSKPTSRSNSSTPQMEPVEVVANLSEKENSNKVSHEVSSSGIGNAVEPPDAAGKHKIIDPFLFPLEDQTKGAKSQDSEDSTPSETTVPSLINVAAILTEREQFDSLVVIGKDFANKTDFTAAELKNYSRIIPRLIITDKMIPPGIRRISLLVATKEGNADRQASKGSLPQLQTQQCLQDQDGQIKSDAVSLTKEQAFGLLVKSVLYEDKAEFNTLINRIVKVNTALEKPEDSVVLSIYGCCKAAVDRYSKLIFNQMLVIASYRLTVLGFDINEATIIPRELLIILGTLVVKQIYVSDRMYKTKKKNPQQNVPTIFILVFLVQWSLTIRLRLLRSECEYCLVSNFHNNPASVTVKELPKFGSVNGLTINAKYPPERTAKFAGLSDGKANDFNNPYNVPGRGPSFYKYKFTGIEEYATYLISNMFDNDPKPLDSVRCICHSSMQSKIYGSLTPGQGIPPKPFGQPPPQYISSIISKSQGDGVCPKKSLKVLIPSNRIPCLRCTGFQHVLDIDIPYMCRERLGMVLSRMRSGSYDGSLDLNASTLDEIMESARDGVNEAIVNEITKRVFDYQQACGCSFSLLCAVALLVGNGGQYSCGSSFISIYASQPCLTASIALEQLVGIYINKPDVHALIQIIVSALTHTQLPSDTKESPAKTLKPLNQAPSSPLSSMIRNHDNKDIETEGIQVSITTPCVYPILALPPSALCHILGCLVRGTKDVSKYRKIITKSVGAVIRDMALKYPEPDISLAFMGSPAEAEELTYNTDNTTQFICTETLSNLSKEGLIITSEVFRQLRCSVVGEPDIVGTLSWYGMDCVLRCAVHLICNSEDCTELSSTSTVTTNGGASSVVIRPYVQKDANEYAVSIKRLTDLVDVVRAYYSALVAERKSKTNNSKASQSSESKNKDKHRRNMIPESLSLVMQVLTALDRLEKCCRPSTKRDMGDNENKQKIRNLAILFWQVTCLHSVPLALPLANRVLTRLFSIPFDPRSGPMTRVDAYRHLSEAIAEMLRPMFISIRLRAKPGEAEPNPEVDEDCEKELSAELPELMLSSSGFGTIPELSLGLRRLEGFICGVVGLYTTNTRSDTISRLIVENFCNYLESNTGKNTTKLSLSNEQLLMIHAAFSQFLIADLYAPIRSGAQATRDSFSKFLPFIFDSSYLVPCYTTVVMGNMVVGILNGGKALSPRFSFPASPTLACYLLTRICVILSTQTDMRAEESCGCAVDRKTVLNVYDGTQRRKNLLPLALSLMTLRRLSPQRYPALIHAHMILATTSNVVNQAVNFRDHQLRLFELWISILCEISTTLSRVHDLSMPVAAPPGETGERETQAAQQHTDISTLVYIRLFLLLSVTLHDHSILHTLLGATPLVQLAPGGQLKNMLQVVSAEYVKSVTSEQTSTPKEQDIGDISTLPSRISSALSKKESIINTCVAEWEKDCATSAAIAGNSKTTSIKDGALPLPPLWHVTTKGVNHAPILGLCDKALFGKQCCFDANLVLLIESFVPYVETDEMKIIAFQVAVHSVARCAPCAAFRFQKELFGDSSVNLSNLMQRLTTIICTLCGGGASHEKDMAIEIGHLFADSMICMLRNGLDSIPSASEGQHIDADCADIQTIVSTDVICRILGGHVKDVPEQFISVARELCLRCVLERAFSIGFHPSGLRGVLGYIESQLKSNSDLSDFLSLYPNVCAELKHRIEE